MFTRASNPARFPNVDAVDPLDRLIPTGTRESPIAFPPRRSPLAFRYGGDQSLSQMNVTHELPGSVPATSATAFAAAAAGSRVPGPCMVCGAPAGSSAPV